MLKHRRAHLFKEGRLTPDCDLDFEETFNKLVIYGSLDKISDKLLLFREKVQYRHLPVFHCGYAQL